MMFLSSNQWLHHIMAFEKAPSSYKNLIKNSELKLIHRMGETPVIPLNLISIR